MKQDPATILANGKPVLGPIDITSKANRFQPRNTMTRAAPKVIHISSFVLKNVPVMNKIIKYGRGKKLGRAHLSEDQVFFTLGSSSSSEKLPQHHLENKVHWVSGSLQHNPFRTASSAEGSSFILQNPKNNLLDTTRTTRKKAELASRKRKMSSRQSSFQLSDCYGHYRGTG